MKIGFYGIDEESTSAPTLCAENLKEALSERGHRTVYVASRSEGEQCDVVHWSSLMDKTLPSRWDVPTVLRYHGDVQWREPFLNYTPHPLLKSAKEILVDIGKIWQFDHVVFTTEYLQDSITSIPGLPVPSNSVVYNGVSDVFTPTCDDSILQKYGIEHPYVLHISSKSRRKNPENLVAALDRIAEAGYNIAIAGPGWDNEYSVGWVDTEDLPALYTHSEAFVFPSYHECFGLPPAESLACGTSPVVSNRYALEETIGEHGILCDPADVDSIKDATMTAIERDTDPYRIMDWTTAAEEMEEVYDVVS